MEDEQAPDDRTLRFLKGLVTVLTATMIVGVITIVALLVMRFSASDDIALPDQITLPAGQTATAFTQGQGWFAVVTETEEIFVYSRSTGALLQRIEVTSE